MKRKRILGILMSILMIITMVPSFTFAAELPFTDVSTSAWYYNDVKSAYDTGLINGMDATTFAPESNMTYAQAVKLAACMNQKYGTGSVILVNGSPNWWDSYTAYAKEKNIINKDYDWNSNATRAGYVEIFAKALPDEALKSKNTVVDGAIPDVDMSHPQASAIYKLYRAGILTGNDEKGTFLPNNPIKRSEVSAILTRMMNESARKELKLNNSTDIKGDAIDTLKNSLKINGEYHNELGYTYGEFIDDDLHIFTNITYDINEDSFYVYTSIDSDENDDYSYGFIYLDGPDSILGTFESGMNVSGIDYYYTGKYDISNYEDIGKYIVENVSDSWEILRLVDDTNLEVTMYEILFAVEALDNYCQKYNLGISSSDLGFVK